MRTKEPQMQTVEFLVRFVVEIDEDLSTDKFLRGWNALDDKGKRDALNKGMRDSMEEVGLLDTVNGGARDIRLVISDNQEQEYLII